MLYFQLGQSIHDGCGQGADNGGTRTARVGEQFQVDISRGVQRSGGYTGPLCTVRIQGVTQGAVRGSGSGGLSHKIKIVV